MLYDAPFHPHTNPMRLPATALVNLILCAWLLVLFAAPAAAWVDPTTGEPHPTHVTRRAAIPEKNWQPGHRGVDLGARPGSDILAAESGVVAYVGTIVGTPVVSIDHADGIRTTYQPVHARVAVGDSVGEGDIIGTLARPTSQFAREHAGLHWGARTGPDSYIDPLTLLEPPPIRLKPLDPTAKEKEATRTRQRRQARGWA